MPRKPSTGRGDVTGRGHAPQSSCDSSHRGTVGFQQQTLLLDARLWRQERPHLKGSRMDLSVARYHPRPRHQYGDHLVTAGNTQLLYLRRRVRQRTRRRACENLALHADTHTGKLRLSKTKRDPLATGRRVRAGTTSMRTIAHRPFRTEKRFTMGLGLDNPAGYLREQYRRGCRSPSTENLLTISTTKVRHTGNRSWPVKRYDVLSKWCESL